MKRRIIYGLFFTSLMIISTISVIAQPAAGASWTFGVPDAAKGMTLESEVKVYDKEKWGTSVGQIVDPDDNVNNWFGGDQINANDVGATSQSKILDWRSDDIWFFGDHLMHSEIGTNTLGLVTYWDAIPYVDGTCVALSANYGGIANVLQIMGYHLSDPVLYNSVLGNMSILATGTPNIEQVTAKYAKTYPGMIVERNKREFDLEHDDKWDLIAENLPFIEDPHNIKDSYDYFIGFAGELFGILDDNSARAQAMTAYLPTTMSAAAFNILETNLGGAGAIYSMLVAGTATSVAYIMGYIKNFFGSKIPDKKTYLNLLLRGGLPAHQPVENWWDKVLDDFDIEDDEIYGINDAPYTHKGGISQDGMVITVEYEWEAGATWVDTDGTVEVLDDYEVVYTYGDTGGQSSVEFKGSDPFYKIESLAPVIPGYEISILLATAAISAIALIYVVMKKKRM